MEDGLRDDPRDVLKRLKEHSESYPAQAEARETWRQRAYELVWRWGEAVSDHPVLRERFLAMASLHCCEEAQSLLRVLQDSIAAARRALESVAKGEHQVEVPGFTSRSGWRFTSEGMRSDLGAVRHVSSRLWEWFDLTHSDKYLLIEDWVGSILAFCEVVVLPTLSTVGNVVDGSEAHDRGSDVDPVAAFEEAMAEAADTISAMTGLLLEGRRAELWRAANWLLLS